MELILMLALVTTSLDEKHGFTEDNPAALLVDAALGSLGL